MSDRQPPLVRQRDERQRDIQPHLTFEVAFRSDIDVIVECNGPATIAPPTPDISGTNSHNDRSPFCARFPAATFPIFSSPFRRQRHDGHRRPASNHYSAITGHSSSSAFQNFPLQTSHFSSSPLYSMIVCGVVMSLSFCLSSASLSNLVGLISGPRESRYGCLAPV